MSTQKDEAESGKASTPVLADAVTEESIALRAYELYLARGASDGQALDDWLQAERELRGQKLNSAAA